ncbi:IS1380-Spn1 transposase [Streptococcus pneumoniae]|nr:IS1380-Spn1 transposase [Streptococcus pneumoniae]
MMNCTPKVRQKKSNFWSVFIMKLTYDDKVQIYELRKQGYSLEKLSNKFEINNSNIRYMIKPQLFTPNLKTIQNPCLSLDPGWFLFSPNGCFLLDKKEFPLYGISVEKNTKRKETHMNSLPNHHFQNKSFYQLSFDGGHLTQYGGLIFFQELFSQLKLKERISKVFSNE